MTDRAAWSQRRLWQLILLEQYRVGPPRSLADVGLSVHSQNDEDGLLLYAFARVGFRTRVAVEIAAGDGIECNSANLLLHHGFTALLFEADPDKRARGADFYAVHPATAYFPPRFVADWVTRDNVDDLVAKHLHPGVLAAGGEVDLLSLDLDGNDYWVLERLTCIRPRVVIVEFNAVWGAERACTIPYDPGFRAELSPVPYVGASLPAFVRLLGRRGYSLVGVERLGFNAVFVRDDLIGRLVTVTAAEALRGPIVGLSQAALAADPTLGADARARPWVDV